MADTDTQKESGTPLVLSCEGTRTELAVSPREETRILSVPSSAGADEHISEYNAAEKLYYNVCLPMDNCLLEVSKEIIRERGGHTSEQNGVSSLHVVLINRLTGSIREQQWLNGAITSSFEGMCKPTEPPAHVQAKF